MKVCFIVNEIFAFGQYGGFGKLVRKVASGLRERGIDVSAVTWRGEGQGKVVQGWNRIWKAYEKDSKLGLPKKEYIGKV
ncbi:hypothetical protein AKJ64_04790 [candidate division MSBL1 archaeon SCGC-AAA259E17]|uniref:Glycosyltransferase subfamily 4-like N-terminal domain-containing protein n=1 Tax=candidate division MSBL1 archaeon SCGC-AAA259E17 TaxID=1698263 RepID=A0A133UAZ7_9EURY|nr:hypothetical protein AKJ64_04790 [candidate division MSBL1 archaeon SCGC-AAA259E17]